MTTAESHQTRGLFFVRKPRRQPIQEPPNPRTCFCPEATQTADSRTFSVRKPRRQPIQEPPKTRFFCSEATQTADSNELLVGSHADGRFKSPVGSEATQTADATATKNKIFLFRSHADSRLKDFLVGSHADGRFKSHHTRGLFFVRKPRRQPIQEPPKTRFFVQKPRRQPLQGLFGRKPRRRPIQEPPKTRFFSEATQTADSRTFWVGNHADGRCNSHRKQDFFVQKPRRQPIQGLFLFGSHADGRSKSHRKQVFFCSEATQTADSRTFCWLEAAQTADSRATEPEDLFFCLEATQTADSRTFFVRKPRRQPIQEPSKNKVFLFRSHTDSAPNIPQSSASNSTGTMMITTACTPGMGAARFKDPLLVGSHADSRVKSHQTRGLVFCLEATQTADSRTFFVRKPRRRPIQEPPKTRFFLFRSHTDSRFEDLLLVGSHADRFKSHQTRGLVFCLEATQTADSRTFFVRKPRRQPIQEPPKSHTDSRFKDLFLFGSHADSRFKSHRTRGLVFCLEATQTANSRTFFVRKPRRQPIQEPPKTRFFLFRSHADSRFKDLLLVGSRADSRFKSHQTRGLVFCLGATQTADSRTFFVRKPRRRPIQEPPETRFCSEATQTADSRTFCWLEATQTADSRATKPEDLFFVWKPRRQPIQGLFLFGSHADSRSNSHRKATQTARFKDLLLVGSHADRFKSHQTRGLVFCLEATQTADSRTFFVRKPRRQPIQEPPKTSFFVQKPHRQPIQGPCVGWKPRRQPIQEPPNPRTCFLFGSHADSRFKDLFCSEATQTADPRATENKAFCSEATQTADSRTFCWLEATQTADSRATKPEDLFFVWKPQRAHARALAGALENLATARGRRLLRRWQCFLLA